MANVHLAKLRSQIKVLIKHFGNNELFINSLLSLFRLYSQDKIPTNIWLQKNLTAPSFNVPQLLLTELQILMDNAAKSNPTASIQTADLLWSLNFYETKMVAIFLLLNVPESFNNEIFNRIDIWVTEDTDDLVLDKLLNYCQDNEQLILSPHWIEVLNRWLRSGEKSLKKTGMKALQKLIEKKEFNYFPRVFKILMPLISEADIEFKKDLIRVIQCLTTRTQAETASFLISNIEMYRNEEVKAFTRRCLPLFDQYFQSEIKKAL